ncbi:MAG: transcription-repair coupling factor, partial [Rhodobiaceae bacterium]|nr:transcription-repair coupling factor [Rhodobiaceae bacterium]
MIAFADTIIEPGVQTELTEVPDGLEPLAIADLARLNGQKGDTEPLLVVLRDGRRLQTVRDALRFFAPELAVIDIPAWDCMPYDRVSPNADVTARRLAGLFRLAAGEKPNMVLTTIAAATQRLIAPQTLKARGLALRASAVAQMDAIVAWLEENGFSREPTVREAGQYAVRGGILDLFVPGEEAPVRLDFFGDTLETLRPFDPETQTSSGRLERLDLVPTSEVALNPDSIRHFRQSYVREIGVPASGDPMYEAVSEGRRFPGVEHWLPLFDDRLGTLFDHLPHAPVVLDALNHDARLERLKQVRDYYQARVDAQEANSFGAPPYRPLAPERLYLTEDDWTAALSGRSVTRLSPFAAAGGTEGKLVVSLGGRHGRTFAAEREARNSNVFDAVATHVKALHDAGKSVTIACWSAGSRDRMAGVLADHAVPNLRMVDRWAEVAGGRGVATALAILPVESGFETETDAVIAEQDILGDRMIRASARKRGKDVLTEVTSLSAGDVVVHADHGIGRFLGLKTIEAMGAPHDCLELEYAGGDKLYLPVENI